MGSTSSRSLSPGVRVRKEAFGLLFYNSKDGKLTFVRSGNLLDVSIDAKRNYSLTPADTSAGAQKILRLVESLAAKGLINET